MTITYFKRVIEVALTGYHSVTMYGDIDQKILVSVPEMLKDFLEYIGFPLCVQVVHSNAIKEGDHMYFRYRDVPLSAWSCLIEQDVYNNVKSAVSLYSPNEIANYQLSEDSVISMLENLYSSVGCGTILRAFVSKFKPSTKDLHNVIRVSRSIAFLDGTRNIQIHHLAEATEYSYARNH